MKSIRYGFLVTLMLVTVGLSAAVLAQQPAWRTFDDGTNCFRVELPDAGWQAIDASHPALQRFVGSGGPPYNIPVTIANTDPQTPASVAIHIRPGRSNLPDSSRDLEKEMRATLAEAGMTLDSASLVKLDGYNAAKLMVRMTLKQVPDQELTQWIYLVPRGDKVFHIMLTAATTEFQRLQPVFQRVADSFSITCGSPLIKWGSGTIYENVIRNMLIAAGVGVLWFIFSALVKARKSK